MDLENINLLMEVHMKENGKIMYNMVKEFLYSKECIKKVFGLMECWLI